MATLMSNDPKTGSHETSGKAVQRPEGKASEGIGGRRRERDVLGGNKRFNIRGRFINGADEEKIPEAVMRQIRTCVQHRHAYT